MNEREIFIEFVNIMREENRRRNFEIFAIPNLRDAGIPVDREVKKYRNTNKYDKKAYPHVYALVTAVSRLIYQSAKKKMKLPVFQLNNLKDVLREVHFQKLDNEILCAILRAMGFNNQRIKTDEGRKSCWICEPQDFITHYPIEIMKSLYDAKLLNKAQKSIEYNGNT